MQVRPALADELKDSGHGRAVQGVPAQTDAGVVRDAGHGFLKRTKFFNHGGYLAALAAMCTASQTLANGGA